MQQYVMTKSASVVTEFVLLLFPVSNFSLVREKQRALSIKSRRSPFLLRSQPHSTGDCLKMVEASEISEYYFGKQSGAGSICTTLVQSVAIYDLNYTALEICTTLNPKASSTTLVQQA